MALPMGVLSGLLGGTTSRFAPIAVPYLHALHLGKREFVFFVTLLYTVAGAVQIASYAQLGLYDLRYLVIIGAALVPNALGISLGLRLQDRIDPILFRRLVLMLVALSGLSLVLRGIWR